MKKNRILIIGLDGATFDVIKPMIKKGKLPNIKKLMENGAYGKLQSTVPPLTPIAWATMVTGKNAGKHGIFDFRRLTHNHEIEIINGSFNKEKTIFELASEAGLRCVVINVPMTYPPKKINGIWVSGMDAPQDSVYTYPPWLAKRLNKEGYKIDLDFIDEKNYFNNLLEIEKKREEVALKLLKKRWDLAMVVFILVDRAQHAFWNKKKVMEKAYETLDLSVGNLVRSFPNAITLIVSDHGAGPIHTGLSINSWLQKKGLLFLKQYPLIDQINVWTVKENTITSENGIIKATIHPNGGSISSDGKELKIKIDKKEKYAYISLGQFEKNIRLEMYAYGSKDGVGFHIGGATTDVLASASLTKESKKYCFNLPPGRIEIVLTTYGAMPTGEMAIQNITVREPDGFLKISKSPVDIIHDIDWEKTKAFAFGYYGSIYLNEQLVTEKEREQVILELRKNIENITTSDGKRILKSVYSKHELFHGPNIKYGPDIIALPEDGYYPIDGFGSIEKDLFVQIPKLMVGSHRMNGILILSNGPFKKKEIRKANILDIFPTVLYLLGLEIPDKIDGKVLESVFQDEYIKTPLKKSALVLQKNQERKYSQEESKLVENRLKNLGYID